MKHKILIKITTTISELNWHLKRSLHNSFTIITITQCNYRMAFLHVFSLREGREGERDGWRDIGREEGREEGREGWSKGGRKERREGGKKEGREGRRERHREGAREGGRETAIN